ncbi:MAG: hypothetical protein LBI49_21110 [Nocardiopsaceae bacterium]|jgi:hypothetical protein|nr:hypothetical protein [Nocardiopsaceae bacterium]
MFQVLVPGGRIGTSDVVTDDRMTTADRAAASSCTGCIADALSREEYLKGLAAAGFSGARHALSDCPRRQACGEGLGDGD